MTSEYFVILCLVWGLGYGDPYLQTSNPVLNNNVIIIANHIKTLLLGHLLTGGATSGVSLWNGSDTGCCTQLCTVF